jgi:hypothetical protein
MCMDERSINGFFFELIFSILVPLFKCNVKHWKEMRKQKMCSKSKTFNKVKIERMDIRKH